MLKRLFIAVFVLGLVVGLNGTANCDVAKGTSALTPITPNVMSAERSAALEYGGPAQSAFKKPAEALEARRVPAGSTVPYPKQNYFCDVQDYTSGSPAYFWAIPDAYGDDLFNMRFTSDANHYCTLKVAHFLMYAPEVIGAPDFKAYLWDDDGFGFPGVKLDSVTIPYADIIAAGGDGSGGNFFWLSADFSAAEWVFADGEEYHLGFTTVDNSGLLTDGLAVISDAADGPYAGEERASEFYSGAWGTMLNDWGLDLSFFILGERCCSEIPFTDCYTSSYITNLYYVWDIPNATYGDAEYASRFDVAGPETLVSIDVAIYDNGDFGDNDVYVTVYDDDGGLPGAQLAQVTLGAGTYPAYPTLANVPIPGNLVVTNDFHVGISTDGVQGFSNEFIVSSDGSDGDLRTSVYADTTNFDGSGLFGWQLMADNWGFDGQFYINANLCKDEYAECSINACYTGLGYLWNLPDRYGDFAQAQQFTGVGQECRVQDVTILLYWSRTKVDWTDLYSENSEVKVWADAGGFPGAELASITLTPADYGITPPTPTTSSSTWKTVDFTSQNVFVSGAYWVGIVSLASDTLTGIFTVSDAGGGECNNAYAEYYGAWGLMDTDWGFGDPSIAMVIESEHCCIPYDERVCTTPFEWSTFQGTQARDGASFVEMSDSWCDLTLNWHFEHPSSAVNFTGPVVYNDYVICSFTTEYRVFQIDGTPLYTYVPSFSFPAGDVRCAPTVTTIAGYPNPVFFASGGANQEISMVDLVTGTPVWTRAVGTVGPAGMFGATRWGVFTVLTMGGIDYVFWGTDDGFVVGADALTGTLMAGYPVTLTQSTWVSGSTDGTSLFYATSATAVEGDIYSIDAATGSINWQLSSVGGLQGGATWASYIGDESFSGGVSYDAQRNYLYANSRVAGGDFPTDGLFYRINAASGALAGPITVANRVLYCTPVIDANRVYVTGFSRWAGPPSGGDVYAINKATGLVDWAIPGGPDNFPYYCSGVLSCEPDGVSDQLFVFGYEGYMSCLEAETGNELWRRRAEAPIAGFNERGMAGALAVDGNGDSHLLYGDTWGNLFDLTKQGDRPRLEFQSYEVSVAVEFGAAASFIVTVPGIFANTGCADLNVTSVAIDENEYGVDVPAFSVSNVNELTFDRTASIADQIAGNNNLLKLTLPSMIEVGDESSALSVRDNSNERRVDRTAAGFPPFMNGIVHPAVGDVILPGDTMDLVMDVIQANINRGPQDFYLQLGTDDPDFFLNDPLLLPQMHITIVGGCLIDTSYMEFGIGGANLQIVTNTGRIGTGDWDPHAFSIDGVDAEYYQGGYVWAVSTYRIAAHTQDWTSGGGEADAFVSMQPDPNWCDNSCKPFLDAGVTLGYMSSDGLTYTPINGNMVCKNFLDSVQNFDLGGGWDWTNWGAPFDNDSTMGLYATGKVVGALDVPELANVTLELLEITERNGNDLPGWYMGEFWDCDLGNDHVAIDRSISTAWVYNDATLDGVWGQIKIPFGCGEEPIINTFQTWGTSGSHGFFDWNQYWDTCFTMLSSPPGAYYFVPAGDEEAHVTFASHDFAPNETYKIGIAHFALFNLTDASSSAEFAYLPVLVNKWAGFGRGDVNDDGAVNLADIIYLAGTVNGGPGAIPFQHLSDVNADAAIDMLDVDYLIDYYFNCGPCPVGDFAF